MMTKASLQSRNGKLGSPKMDRSFERYQPSGARADFVIVDDPFDGAPLVADLPATKNDRASRRAQTQKPKRKLFRA